MTTLMDVRKEKVARAVKETFATIRTFDPDLYRYALTVVSKLDEEDWQQQAKEAGDRRARLNGRVSRYAS